MQTYSVVQSRIMYVFVLLASLIVKMCTSGKISHNSRIISRQKSPISIGKRLLIYMVLPSRASILMSATIHSAYNLAESIGFSDKLSRYSRDTIIFYLDSDLAHTNSIFGRNNLSMLSKPFLYLPYPFLGVVFCFVHISF